MEKEEIKEVSSSDPLLKSQNEFEKQRVKLNQIYTDLEKNGQNEKRFAE